MIRRTNWAIDGHLCVDCCARLVHSVRAVESVVDAHFDLDDELLLVRHRSAPKAVASIQTAASMAGFRLTRRVDGGDGGWDATLGPTASAHPWVH